MNLGRGTAVCNYSPECHSGNYISILTPTETSNKAPFSSGSTLFPVNFQILRVRHHLSKVLSRGGFWLVDGAVWAGSAAALNQWLVFASPSFHQRRIEPTLYLFPVMYSHCKEKAFEIILLKCGNWGNAGIYDTPCYLTPCTYFVVAVNNISKSSHYPMMEGIAALKMSHFPYIFFKFWLNFQKVGMIWIQSCLRDSIVAPHYTRINSENHPTLNKQNQDLLYFHQKIILLLAIIVVPVFQ